MQRHGLNKTITFGYFIQSFVEQEGHFSDHIDVGILLFEWIYVQVAQPVF